MSKFLKAFKYASIVSVMVNAIGFIISILFNGIERVLDIYKEVAPLSLSLIFFPCFFSIYYFKMNEYKELRRIIKTIIKPACLSFIAIYIIFYLTITFYKTDHTPIPFWNKGSLFNGITAIILLVFSSLIYYLIVNKNDRKRTNKNISLSVTTSMFIWLIISVLYVLIVSVLKGYSLPINYMLSVTISGVCAAVFMFLVIRFKYNKRVVVVLAYLINILLLPLLFYVLLRPFAFDLSKYFPSFSLVFYIRSVIMEGSYFLFITLTIHSYFIFKENKKQKQNLKQIGVTASLKYRQLKAQLSPHFLFNNISVLTGLIEEDQERAIQFSEKLSHVYRYFLNQENQDLVLLKDELVFAKEYLELLQVRFENAMTFTDRTEDFSEYYILPMALQQVFENVIKHNEISMESYICIEMVIEGDYLVVKNNKNPKEDVGKGKQTGLKNIINRYAFFTDEKVMIINDEQYYTIKLPLLKIEN
ncbi:sensor histidine kinase [Flavivirga jejuensis]|uniref:Histidine kinase n=1 Tax=Flavivirga jejuensis TaxID=870487 RepID=A0ABT8WR74_9FLAO|nr:sensor histidine kinase [Flavivirga jejuensis]MDO5975636.1 histidine kinase [Flavivirga jejuensis]